MDSPAGEFAPALAAPGILERVVVRTMRLDLGDRSVVLREYLPVNTDRELDAVVYLHGGLATGDNDYDADRTLLATEAKVRVVSIGYRDAPGQVTDGAALEDCVAAVRFIHERGGFRTLSLAGDGAGGSLAIVVAQALLGEITFAAQLLLYPGTGTAPTSRVRAAPADLEWNYAAYSAEETPAVEPGQNPQYGSLRGLPPTVLVDAGLDSTQDDGRALASRLVDADVEIVFLPNPTLARGFQRTAGSSDAAGQATRRAYWALAATVANAR